MSADARGGHERLHDPCRADRRDWTEDETDGAPLRWLLTAGVVAGVLGLALVLLFAL